MVESGLVFLAIRFSPGLKPEISGAATLMNRREFAKNELPFTSDKVDFYAFSLFFGNASASSETDPLSEIKQASR
jgi:hypothetical protein